VSLVVLTLATLYGISQTRYFQRLAIKEITSAISRSIDADVSIGRVKMSLFSRVTLDEFYLSDQHKDTLLYTQKLVVRVDSISFIRKNIHFKTIVLVNPKVVVKKHDDKSFNFSFLLGLDDNKRLENGWNANCSMVEVRNGEFLYSDPILKQQFQDLTHFRKIDMLLDRVELGRQSNFSFNLHNLNFTCDNGFEVSEIASEFWFADSTVSIRNLNAVASNSFLKIDTLAFDLKKYWTTNNFFDLKFDLLIEKLKFDYSDFSFLFPQFEGAGFTGEMSGRLYGKPAEIKGKDFKANIGDLTRVNGDFYINGLPDLENTYLFVNLLESYANLNQLRNVEFPAAITPLKIELPRFLDNVGVFSYRGNFTGFLNDFVAYGSAYSNLGSIEGDVSFKPTKDDMLKVKGHVTTKNLRIGSIFKVDYLGKLTLNGDVDGTIKDTLFNLSFNGVIDTIDIKNYQYQNIIVKGTLQNKLFDGALTINDPNLKMDYEGNLDLSPSLPAFKFRANVSYADLSALNLMSDSVSMISGVVRANFKGNIIDNMQGDIDIEKLRYRNSTGMLYLERATVNNSDQGDVSLLTIKSDWFDAEVNGRYNFFDFKTTLTRFYQHYMPSSFTAEAYERFYENEFTYVVNVKNTDPLTTVFVPGLKIKSPFAIHGFFNNNTLGAYLLTTIPGIDYEDYKAENLSVDLRAAPNDFTCIISSNNLQLAKNIGMQNLKVLATGKDDRLATNLSWKNEGLKRSSGDIHTVATFERNRTRFPHITLEVAPAEIFVNDSCWNLTSSSIEMDSTAFSAAEISLTNGIQKLLVGGKINENSDARVSFRFDELDFRTFDLILGESGFGGRLNGRFEITGFYSRRNFDLDLSLMELSYQSKYLGDLIMKCKWNPEIEKLVSSVTLKDKDRFVVNGKGLIDPVNNSLDLKLDLDKTPISVLGVFAPFLFYELEGGINGNMHIHGKTNQLMYDGKLVPDTRAGIGLTFLKTHYYFSDPVYFNNDSMLFKNIKIEDELGNKALLNGSIKHSTFQKMSYDLTVNTDKILAMNTTIANNEWFYGTAIAGGNLSITGKGNEVSLDGDFKSEKGTTIFIPLERRGKVEKYDFIRFVNAQSTAEQPVEFKPVSSGLNMNFDIEVTPDAKVQLIFNSQIGDIIRGEGNGNVQVKVDKDFNLKLYGDYLIEKGDYLFTLENIINKRFTINRGGTIKWTGDPYDAQIDLTALYKVKTSLYDLFPEGSGAKDLDRVRRLPVDCIIQLKESLLQPTIDFKIELPTAEESLKDAVNQLIVTKEDVNKQMISLLMLGRFYTPEFFAGKPTTETGTEFMGATASELLSNQLSNWLSQITDQLDIGVNIRPGNEISNDQVELALSTQILNDRVTIDGNIANNSNLNTKNSRDLVGDFDVKIKLTNDNRLQLKVYNHANDYVSYEYETGVYTQGIGLSYREEFNTLRELYQRYKEALTRKRVKTPDPKNED
jgi:hypothetical protein